MQHGFIVDILRYGDYYYLRDGFQLGVDVLHIFKLDH